MTEYVLVEGEVTKSTELAIRMVVSGATAYDLTEYWIPRSMIEDGEDTSIGDEAISLAKWWADDRGVFY